MATALRTQYPDASWHVMNREGRAELVFAWGKDYELFVALLRESFDRWNLAPVAVHREWQGRGYGSDLIRQTLVQSRISCSPVFVLGDPGYYTRFGFYRMREPRCPYDPANEQFMALRYTCDDAFMIGYEAEFSGG